MRSNFVVTWLALSGGLPDMFRTASNCTGDGFTAIAFEHFFDRFFSTRSPRRRRDAEKTQDQSATEGTENTESLRRSI
jgi:hypothetical protein